jgi:uncharacterized protein (DUF1810 family)
MRGRSSGPSATTATISTEAGRVSDPFDLDRFVVVQTDSYEQALGEIRRGAKRSHWMWYIFPQIVGLGRSGIARHYAVRSLAEARAYLAHPLLGPRLLACVAALQDLPANATAQGVFGGIDAMKLNSSLTLFEAAGGDPMFAAAIERWFGGRRDDATMRLLNAESAA